MLHIADEAPSCLHPSSEKYLPRPKIYLEMTGLEHTATP